MAGLLPLVLQSKLLGFLMGCNEFSVDLLQAAVPGMLPELMLCHQL